jgi:hypothetical protein
VQNGGSRSRTVKAVSDGLPHCLLFSACRNSRQSLLPDDCPDYARSSKVSSTSGAAGDPVAEVELAAASGLDVRDDRGEHVAPLLVLGNGPRGRGDVREDAVLEVEDQPRVLPAVLVRACPVVPLAASCGDESGKHAGVPHCRPSPKQR